MKINRDVFKKVKAQLNKKQITALVGARQIGKTTILKELQKSIKDKTILITFENLDDLNLFSNDIELFIDKYIRPYDVIFIDEFQYAKKGGQKLKYIYDTIENKKIFISGSSHAELAIHSLQYLVGRVSIIEVFPLTFKEFLEFKSPNDLVFLEDIRKISSLKIIDKYFREYLTYGGYPDIVLEDDFDQKKSLLKDIIQSYLFKEIKDILEYKNIHEFERTLKRLALQDSSLLNKNSFSEDFGIYFKKIDEIIYTLDRTYILYLIQPFLKNKIKEQIKSPKTIIQDLGFKNSLINNFNDLNLRVDKGYIFENFIFNELYRLGIRAQFFNEQNRYEVDFVYEKDGYITGIECKSQFKKLEFTKSIKRFIDQFKPKRVIVFNEKVEGELEYADCRVIFTHYLNIYQVEKL